VPHVVLLDTKQHDRNGFACGEPTLDGCLREPAVQQHRDGIATTHVLIEPSQPTGVLGYCALSAAQLLLGDLQETDRRRLPR
jgi:hypothetical protein